MPVVFEISIEVMVSCSGTFYIKKLSTIHIHFYYSENCKTISPSILYATLAKKHIKRETIRL